MINSIAKHLKQLMIVCAIALCTLTLIAPPSLAHQQKVQGNTDCQTMDCSERHHPGPKNSQGHSRRGNLDGVKAPFSSASKNVMTFKGEVIDVYEMDSQRGNRSGTHLLLKANGETQEVRLGPSWYLEEKDFSIEPEDFIQIEGKQSGQAGQSAIKAFKVIKGEQVLRLRDEQGKPLWRHSAQQ